MKYRSEIIAKAQIKQKPEDFIVEEDSLRIGQLNINETYDFDESSQGDHLVFVLNKKDVDTFRLLKSLSSYLGVSPKRFSFAGTKDKKAHTVQLGSAYKISKEKLMLFSHPKVKIFPIRYSDKKVYLGELKGNRFTIVLRDLSIYPINIEKIYQHLNLYENHFPNFYGPQRLGDKGEGAILGEMLLKRDYEGFIVTYIKSSFQDIEDLSWENIVELYSKLSHEKSKYYYEYLLISYLFHHNARDYVGALRRLPSSLLKMFVNAFQSKIFNDVLSRLIEEWDFEELKNLEIYVHGSEKSEVLFKQGYEEYIAHIYEKKNITHTAFIFKEFGFESKGLIRKAFEQAKDVKFSQSSQYVVAKFYLPKGAYATVFLSQFFDLSQ